MAGSPAHAIPTTCTQGTAFSASTADVAVVDRRVAPQELAELLTWFTSTASALDVATLASCPRVQQQYQHFRADHLDRLNASNLARARLWLALAIVAIAAFVFFALR